MEVKLFVHSSAAEAEKTVNEWLQRNNVKIEYIGQSQSEQSGRFVFIFSLFYSRKNTSQRFEHNTNSDQCFSTEASFS